MIISLFKNMSWILSAAVHIGLGADMHIYNVASSWSKGQAFSVIILTTQLLAEMLDNASSHIPQEVRAHIQQLLRLLWM